MPRICVPIVGGTLAAVVGQIEQAEAEGADLLELRVDHWQDIQPEALESILATSGLPMIVTPRHPSEGGIWSPLEHDRLAWAEAAVEYGAAYVDLELSTDESYLKSLIHFQDQTQIILSFHDFEGTPSLDELKAKLEEMRSLDNHPIIAKFATLAKAAEDNAVMQHLLEYALSQSQPILAMTMGERAQEERVEFPLLGSLWAYAALDAERATAPGQLTLTALHAIYAARGLCYTRPIL